MNQVLAIRKKYIGGKVCLPASKSISNRVLLIRALAGSSSPVENLARCDDTESMLRVLNAGGHCFDVGHAGTAMRFLTAFLARRPGNWELTGSERMKQRPIGVLVEALNRLGARIGYPEKPGFPPLHIEGAGLTGGELEIPASVSSQYISALMMIAPCMEKGLVLRLSGKVVSGSYIGMTEEIMRLFGAEVVRQGNVIRIAPGRYRSVPFRVESDWSAASYFYELLAVAEGGEIYLPGLRKDSMQGDRRQTEVWKKLGVDTCFTEDGVVLSKTLPCSGRLAYDFVEMPDLVQSFAVACCLLDIPFVFEGMETLRIKETDRIQALVDELAKLGYLLRAEGDRRLLWEGRKGKVQERPEIHTYHDHRMAMAFAPAALKYPGLVIVDKEVVAKSFPAYWDELLQLCGETANEG